MERSKQLMAQIRESGVHPYPKWRFVLVKMLHTAGFVLCVISGAAAFSIVLFAVQQTDFDLLGHIGHSRMEAILALLPLLWIVVSVLAVLVAMYGIRYSERGYKFTLARQFGYSAVLSILLGTLGFISGGARVLEHTFDTELSLYESIQEKKVRLWMAPEEGRLAGRIVGVDKEVLNLQDFEGNSWKVYIHGAFVAPIVELEPGEEVKVFGNKSGSAEFLATDIRPWQGFGHPLHHANGR